MQGGIGLGINLTAGSKKKSIFSKVVIVDRFLFHYGQDLGGHWS